MSFGTALQRALVDPIGLRAFERGFEPSLVEAFACPLDCGNGGIQHLGDLSVAERLSLGVIAYDVGFEQDAGSVQLTRWGAARRDELVQVHSLLFAELDEVFLFHSSSPPETDQPQDKLLHRNVKSSLTED
jgi:hypothetical protein